MNSNLTMRQMLQLIQKGGNPEQLVLSFLKEQAAGNPMLETLLRMAQEGDSRGVEQFARNVVKEKGDNFDQQFSNFRKTLGV